MGSMMEYKGYHATIKFDAEDMLFIGKVFGIADSLNFHGTSVDELKKMFHQSIDNYLDICAKFGKKPDKEFKGNFNVRLSPTLHRKLALEAENQNMTLNQYVTKALEMYVYNEEKEKETIKETIYILPYKIKDVDLNVDRRINFLYNGYDNVIPQEFERRDSFVIKGGLNYEN